MSEQYSEGTRAICEVKLTCVRDANFITTDKKPKVMEKYAN
jgi:hypothetical protein